ncbi:MAG: 5'-methylthioadenosine nucleosidase [Planctomycetaceae bacterium]
MSAPPADPTAEDHSRADVGLVCALSMELNHFFDRCEKVRAMSGGGFRFRGGRLAGVRVAAVESGPDPAKAARATRALLDGHRPAWIVCCGFAGALGEGVRIGDIVVSTVIHRVDEDDVPTPHGMASDPTKGLHVGDLVTTDHIVRTIAEKQALAAATGAIACDMESHAVAVVCREAGVPFMAVRAITDDLSTDLPAEVHALLEKTGAGRLGAAFGAMWNRPESVKDLWKLRENAVVAARRLAPFLEGVVKQLHAASERRD